MSSGNIVADLIGPAAPAVPALETSPAEIEIGTFAVGTQSEGARPLEPHVSNGGMGALGRSLTR